jgi:hypothetical protein
LKANTKHENREQKKISVQNCAVEKSTRHIRNGESEKTFHENPLIVLLISGNQPNLTTRPDTQQFKIFPYFTLYIK